MCLVLHPDFIETTWNSLLFLAAQSYEWFRFGLKKRFHIFNVWTLMCVNVSSIEFRSSSQRLAVENRSKHLITGFFEAMKAFVWKLHHNRKMKTHRTRTLVRYICSVCLSIERFPIFTLFNQSTSVSSSCAF